MTSTSTGCVNSDTLDFTVNDFSAGIDAPATACVGEAVQIDNASTAGSTAWGWTFGDAGSSSLQNNSHVYNTAGTYTISLNAQNSAAGCIPLSVDFESSSTTQGNGLPIESYEWTFYDLTTETTQDVNFTFDELGSFATYLEVTDEFGCESLPAPPYIVDITKPTVNFSMDTVVCNMENFAISNQSGGVGDLDYIWNIDGVTVSDELTYDGQFNDTESLQ